VIIVEREAPRAVQAFDAVADSFDERFGAWASVTAQRAAVRRELLRVFPARSRLLELGGGTGLDAIHMALHDREVLLTDGSSAMVARAAENVSRAGLAHRIGTRVLVLEEIDVLAREREANGEPPFDGAYSNFAALNCVEDLASLGSALSRIVRPGGHLVVVVFGTLSIGEILVQLAKRDVRAAFRRFRTAGAPARLSGREFTVWYPTPGDIAKAFAPSFRRVRTRGVGVFVPPSAAEPGISAWPRLLALLERLDRFADVPLARLADHVLLVFQRT
jgi:predicted O-methyltransferase YrrM